MTIQLMLMTDEMEKLSKSPVTYAELTGTLRAECSVLEPVITIQVEQSQLNIAVLNYAYIPDFGRYYYITGIRVLRNSLWEIALKVDVLMTYSGQIRALTARVARTQGTDKMLRDEQVQAYADPYVSTINFPSGMPTPTFILAAIGKPITETEATV